jgi:AcrR family transcriptional regulator
MKATTVGIEAASLYSHIKSKESILQQICFSMAEQFMQIIEQLGKENLSLENKLAKAIELHVQVIANNTDASGVFLHDWKHLSEPHLSKFKSLRKKYESFYIELIQEGIENKRFKNIDTKFVVMNLFSGMNWIYDYYKPNRKMQPKEIADNLVDLLLNGLKIN